MGDWCEGVNCTAFMELGNVTIPETCFLEEAGCNAMNVDRIVLALTVTTAILAARAVLR